MSNLFFRYPIVQWFLKSSRPNWLKHFVYFYKAKATVSSRFDENEVTNYLLCKIVQEKTQYTNHNQHERSFPFDLLLIFCGYYMKKKQIQILIKEGKNLHIQIIDSVKIAFFFFIYL